MLAIDRLHLRGEFARKQMEKGWPFDRPEHLELTKARQDALGSFLLELDANRKMVNALDIGCGVGRFTSFLHERGFHVLGIDGRNINIQEARRRHPNLSFAVHDVESPNLRQLGKFDFVLCVGLIYHLENPFQAIRNLAAITSVCMYVEAMIVDDRRAVALLCDEGRTESQGLRHIAFIPSERCLVKMLYQAGFRNVYRPVLPDEATYRSSILHVRRRTVLVAAHEPLPIGSLVRLPQPWCPKPSWVRWRHLAQVGTATKRVVSFALRALLPPLRCSNPKN